MAFIPIQVLEVMTQPTRLNRTVREDMDVGRRQNYRRIAEATARVQVLLRGVHDDLDNEVNAFVNNEYAEETIDARNHMEEDEELIVDNEEERNAEEYEDEDEQDLEDYYSMEDFDGESNSDNKEEEEDPYGYFHELEQQQRQNVFRNALAQWVLGCSVTKSAVTDLLKILRTQENLSFLPQSYKTLISTPRSVELQDLQPGQYYYFGLENGIIFALKSLNIDMNSVNGVRDRKSVV